MTYSVVTCPPKFQAYIGKQFDLNGVTNASFVGGSPQQSPITSQIPTSSAKQSQMPTTSFAKTSPKKSNYMSPIPTKSNAKKSPKASGYTSSNPVNSTRLQNESSKMNWNFFLVLGILLLIYFLK